MARKPRIEFPGAFYHVLARGNNKQVIFKYDQDFKVYIERIERYYKRYDFKLFAYVLMPNHIHFLIETTETPLSKIMQCLQQSYTAYFHKQYGSVGHLFQGRYKAILCQKESYLLELLRYIHLNPVRAGLVHFPEDYRWSSYHAFFGNISHKFIDANFIYELFDKDVMTGRELFWHFTRNGLNIGHKKEFYELVDQTFLGSPEFTHRCRARENKKEKSEFELIDSKSDQNMSLYEILEVVSKISMVSKDKMLSSSRQRIASNARSLFIYIASRYTKADNERLSLLIERDSSNIPNMIRRIESRLKMDKALAEAYEKIIKVIKA